MFPPWFVSAPAGYRGVARVRQRPRALEGNGATLTDGSHHGVALSASAEAFSPRVMIDFGQTSPCRANEKMPLRPGETPARVRRPRKRRCLLVQKAMEARASSFRVRARCSEQTHRAKACGAKACGAKACGDRDERRELHHRRASSGATLKGVCVSRPETQKENAAAHTGVLVVSRYRFKCSQILI
jgi:hypothetical protein